MNRGNGVTEDFTILERKQIKEWSEKAKEKNVKEKDEIVCRVRGCPSTPLYLKKVERKKE